MKDEELLRFSRQIMLPQWDLAGQEALAAASVLIVGVGGLGSAAALYLGSAGIGRLLLADDDRVELSNLQRQIIHQRSSIGQPKTVSAASTLHAITPELDITCIETRLQGAAMTNAVGDATLVLDATDNLATRYALNDACLHHRVPMVSAAAIRFEAQITVFDPRDAASPCYRCLFPNGTDEALNCADNGVIAPLVGIIGAMQALEAMKVIAGVGTALIGRVLAFDALTSEWQSFNLRRDPACPACGQIR